MPEHGLESDCRVMDCPDCVQHYEAHIAQSLRRDDVQEFMQVYNLGANIGSVSVRYRQTVGDFYADCRVPPRDGRTRERIVTASAHGRAEALEALAVKVAATLYPVDG